MARQAGVLKKERPSATTRWRVLPEHFSKTEAEVCAPVLVTLPLRICAQAGRGTKHMNTKVRKFLALVTMLLATLGCREAASREYSSSSGHIAGESVTEGRKNMDSADIGVFNFETKTVLLNSGYHMPIVGIGTYSLSHDVCVKSVTEHLKAGGRLIDTAFMYHNEKAVGQGVRESGIPREEVFVITKLYPSQFANAEAAIEEALKKLDLGYIDMMLLHHPGSHEVEAYKAMERAVQAGKVRSIGLSCFYIKELDKFLPQVSIMPALVQNEIHPYYQDNDVIPYIQSKGIVVQGWYPLGGRGYTAQLLNNPVITEIAWANGKSSAQVILRWNLQKSVVVIPGSGNPAHIRENLDLFDFELADEEMARINALDRGEKHDWY